MHPVGKRKFLFVDLHFTCYLCHCPVRKEHKLLDELMCLFAFLYNYSYGFAFFIELEPYFL